MDINVLDGSHTKEFIRLCKRFKLRKGVTAEDLINEGKFMNHYEPVLYFLKMLRTPKDDYPCSLSININKNTLEIESIDIFEEFFGRPHSCGKEEFFQCKRIMDGLVNKGLFVWKDGQ